jgi:hypothetical protein
LPFRESLQPIDRKVKVMFTDPMVITVNAVAKSMSRINQDSYSSEYLLKETTGEYRVRTRNSTYKDKNRASKQVERHNIEFTYTIYPVSPATYPTIRKCYIVFETDTGDDAVLMAKLVIGLEAFLAEAQVTRLLNFES